MRPKRPGRRRENGFILVEALVALILLSIMLVLFGSALQLGQRVVEAGRTRDQLAAVAAGVDAMSRMLAGAMPVLDRTNEEEPVVLFEGQPNRIAFVTISEGETHTGGLVAAVIRFNAAAGANSGAVDVGTALIPVGDRLSLATEVSGQEILIRRVRDLEFSYFGAQAKGQPATWHNAWTGATLLPQLVSLRARVLLQRREELLEFTFRVYNG